MFAMRNRSSFFSSSAAAVCMLVQLFQFPAILMILVMVGCRAKQIVGGGGGRESRHPSSCGNIRNISFPFRLRSDPANGGDSYYRSYYPSYNRHSYQLSCESNRTVLYLDGSNKFWVEAIDYEKGTIRVVDSSLQRSDCTSLPRYSSVLYGLRHYRNWPYPMTLHYLSMNPFTLYYLSINSWINFVNCSVPMDKVPTSYLDIVKGCSSSASSGAAYHHHHLYVIPGETTLFDLHPHCKVVAKAPTSTMLPQPSVWNSSSTHIKIHDTLLEGYLLFWGWNVACGKCYEKGLDCSYEDAVGFGVRSVRCNRDFRPLQWFMDLTRRTSVLIAHYTFVYRGLIIKYTGFFVMGRGFIGMLCLFSFLVYKLRRRHIWMDTTVEEFLIKYRYQTPTRYSYSDIQKMTRNFREKLGQGGFGSVYKGNLRTGKAIAVKVLSSKSKGDGQEFINEVATIGRIHHVNVVRLIGFCAEGSRRALIYEFMPNGSLEKYIYPQQGKSCTLSWEKVYQIALGVARGIEYLHQGCDMKILHFDIKPHNILLDKNFTPKVSDFGLAKYYPTDESIVSVTAVRGTVGYIAPELFYKNNGGVSYKSDVYSFGMLLMEMAGRRKNVDAFAKNSSQIYFPLWIYEQLNQGGDMGMEDVAEDQKEVAKKMIIVALWCIQMKPIDRPSMGKVLEMLQGSVELLHLPPRPFLSSPERTPNKGHESTTHTAKSSSIHELISTSQDNAESNDITLIVD